MHLKVFLKLKNPKHSLFWVKKPQKPKKPKNPLSWFFLKKTGFFQPCLVGQQELQLVGHEDLQRQGLHLHKAGVR
jgi:hypothetical protein